MRRSTQWVIIGRLTLAALLIATPLQPQATFAEDFADAISVVVVPETTGLAGRGRGLGIHFGEITHYGTLRGVNGASRSTSSYTTTRQIRLRIARRSGLPGRVVLSASLARDCFPVMLSVDGIRLSPSPRPIGTDLELNGVTAHRLELQVPDTAPPGRVDAEIVWHAELR